MVDLQGISKIFNPGTVNQSQLFHNFSVSVKKGEFMAVVGSNGSGKTTMLNIISGTLTPTSGNVLLDGKNITPWPEFKRARHIGRVFQDPALGTVPSMTITENLALAANKGKPYRFKMALSGRKTADFQAQVAQLGLGLEDKMNVPVGLLSGGQRQALSLLMSTMTPIDLLLLDEHTAALDPHTAETIMQLTDRIVREKNLTAIMVTHNLRYAVEYGTRLYMMDKGHAVLDCSGAEKQAMQVEDILQLFNQISIECGN